MLKKCPFSIKLPWHICQKSLTVNGKVLFLDSILFCWSLSFLLLVPHWVLYSCIVYFEIERWIFQLCFWNCFGLFGFFVFPYNFQAHQKEKNILTGMLIQECVEPIDQFSKNAINIQSASLWGQCLCLLRSPFILSEIFYSFYYTSVMFIKSQVFLMAVIIVFLISFSGALRLLLCIEFLWSY